MHCILYTVRVHDSVAAVAAVAAVWTWWRDGVLLIMGASTEVEKIGLEMGLGLGT